MPQRDRVVVGVDGSDPAAAALAWAGRLVRGTPSRLVAAVVADAGDEDRARRAVAAAVDRLPAGVRGTVTIEVVAGEPAPRLAEIAGDDLLVIGTHKTGFLRGRVLGSRSLLIASLAAGPVAIVPPAALSGRRGVVAGIEPHRDPAAPVLAAARHAARLGEELVVVGAAGAAPDPAVALVGERHPGLPVRSRRSERPPAEAFLDASRAAHLLVAGATDADRAVAFAGSAAHDIVLNVNAPLLLVPTGPGPAIAV